MAARHKKKAKGGGVAIAGGNPEVIKEAKARKSGGKCIGKMHGGAATKRLDRPGRKRGGRVGADVAPLSTANRDAKADAAPKSQTGGAST